MILNKLKKKITKKDLISALIIISISLILIIPLPYYVITGGGILNIDKKITLENENKSSGSLNSAYVSETKGTVLTYLLSKIIPTYELEKIEDVIGEEDERSYETREKISFDNSINNAIYVAYNKAGKDIKLINEKTYVVYIENSAETNLEVGDQVIKINGSEVSSNKDIKKEIEKSNNEIELEVINNNKKYTRYAKIKDNKIGVYLETTFECETENKIKLSFDQTEAGPSGGLMMSLSIYKKLVDEDITKGRKIVGTGTIDTDGNVGEIGGVKYKLLGAVKSKADIFLVPYGNYDEAIRYKNENNYDIEIIKVATFDEALNTLKSKNN